MGCMPTLAALLALAIPLAAHDDTPVYGDPLVSTTPTNFVPVDDRDERPLRSDDEYAELAARLREAYAGDVATWPPAQTLPGADVTPMGLVPPAPEPRDNPSTDTKRELGELLFFDGRLSGTSQMACGSCHVAELGWADGRARSLGHGAGQLQRNTPSMLNAGHQEFLFADGRAGSLEELVVAVLTNADEMANDPEAIEAGIRAIPGYPPLFEAAFGDERVTLDRVAKAVAVHVRDVVSEPSSDFDDFLEGDVDALSDEALRGLHLFRTDAGCMNCHSGPILSDGGFHNIGLAYYGRRFEDLGRYRVTNDPADVGRFRTPSLRNVARTAPYAHTGFFPDLLGMVNIYDAGGARPRRPDKFADDPLWPTTSDLLRPLHLNDRDKADLVAFLESLTERGRRDMLPELPPDAPADR